jgi:hypothetical protein
MIAQSQAKGLSVSICPEPLGIDIQSVGRVPGGTQGLGGGIGAMPAPTPWARS